MNVFIKPKQTQRRKKRTWLPKGKAHRAKLEIWDQQIHTTYIKQITNKDLLYSTGNNIQYLVIT